MEAGATVPIIQVENLHKRFGGLTAIKNLSFTVSPGEILGIIGPNGSGKSTLFNLITGLLKPDGGKIKFDNKDISGFKPHHICQEGIGRTFQLVRPFTQLTVLENVMVGWCFGHGHVRGLTEARVESQKILEFIGLTRKSRTAAAGLNLVDRRRLEVARALATEPRVLLLDEIMAGLNPKEIEDAMRVVKEIRGAGVTILVVEHVMRAVLGLSDRVIVLSTGETIAAGTPEEVANNRQVIEAYLGDEGYA
jgi:branched-chain amino acid transport system ATP-binding protein